MKTFRIVGAIFCVFGFFFALMGILSFVFPLIDNDNIKMILNSFQEPSTDTLTNTLNSIVLFCLNSAYFLIFCGISLMVAGGLISATAHKKQEVFEEAAYQVADAAPVASDTPGVPNPAYYPGGMEPAPQSADTGSGIKVTMLNDDDPVEFSVSMPMKSEKISAASELLLSSDDDDARRLLQYDEQIKSAAVSESKPDYAQYRSNSPQDEPPTAAEDAQQAQESAAPTQPAKPRIVSTMGKRRF